MNRTIIVAEKLSKKYGEVTAVESLDLSVGNEIYGFLGPNGSGKTTTVSMLTSLLSPTSGRASVCGYDIVKERKKVRECMSFVPQSMAVDIKLTGRENVELYCKLFGINDRNERKRRTEDALEVMNLSDRADHRVKTYSGGMQRRLELAQALVHQPEVMFLDEPTVGLDVSARHSIWEQISKLSRAGITVFVTTHQMEEAERYCDRVGIVKKGVLVKEGRPFDLKAAIRSTVSIKTRGGVLSDIPEGAEVIGIKDDEMLFSAENGGEMLPVIIKAFEREGIEVFSTMIRDPTLEDIYLSSVGAGTEDLGAFNKGQFDHIMRRVR